MTGTATGSQRRGGCATAVAIGAFTVLATDVIFSLVTQRPLNFPEEWVALLSQIGIASFPFGLLAISGVRDKRVWLLGIALTWALWGFYLFEVIRYHRSDDTSGANIGLGVFMLFAPVAIAVVCVVAAKRWRRNRL